MEDNKELTAAYDLVLDHLTENNAHTTAALLEATYPIGYPLYMRYTSEQIHRAYKAAQLVLSGTQ